MITLIKIVLTVVVLTVCGAHNILVVFPFPSKSHSILGHGVVRHLLDAGNEITYITPFPIKNPHPKLTQVDVSSTLADFKVDEFLNMAKIIEEGVPVDDFVFLLKILKEVSTTAMQHENVQNLVKDSSQRFDAVIAEWMLSDIYSGFPQIYACPYILYTSVDMSTMTLPSIDEIPNPAYTSSTQLPHLPPFTFLGRVKELYLQSFNTFLRNFIFHKSAAEEYYKIFTPLLENFGRPVLPYEDVKHNLSLVLANSHVSLGYAQKLPLNYLNIGGYHIETEVQPLPKDLQELMDNAKHGVIYFSMGSNLKSKDFPVKIKTSLLQMFGTLKQTVLWKFEENLTNVPDNVKILQWAPQPSILAHPNCVLFITHGGLLSITETVHFGVPVIGIPVFGDQFVNVELAVIKGFAKRVDIYHVVSELKVAIDEILSTQTYKEKVKELSFIYHHRPIHPGKLLAHGVEHVIMTKGAPHLRSPASMTPWYQKLYLDLAAIVLAVLFTIKILLKVLFVSICGKKSENNKKKE